MSKKLLLADDSVVIQKLVGLSFANEDIEIISTDNGDDAIAMAREIQPDVVLADVVMPGLSGYEVCEAIKRDANLAQTPVLLLTGTFEAFDESRADAVGANGQITKPFEAQALVERVNEVMSAPPVSPTASAAAIPSENASEKPAPTSATEPPRAASAAMRSTPPMPSAPPRSSATSDETIVTSLGSTPESADLFDPNVGQLSADASDEASLDLTPQLDVSEQTGSHFFGAPGEGAAEELDTAGGSMAIGQSVPRDATPNAPAPRAADEADGSTKATNTIDTANVDAAEDATVEVSAASGLPPIARPKPATSFAREQSPASSGAVDHPRIDESPSEPLPAARPVDLDAALDAAPSDPDSTILVATDDVNASTSPNLDDLDAEPAPSDFDDLTVHAPSSDIDQDRATAPSPEVIADTRSRPEATRVADLDAALTNETSVRAGASRDEDPLGLAPSNAASEDVGYAFDVSEQVAADESRSGDPDDSFSSLMDISESAILDAAGEPEADAPELTSSPAETVVAGYDVSTSDLVTAPRVDAPPRPRAPEPEPLIEVPELPDAYRPAAPTPAAPERATTRTPSAPNTTAARESDDLFDDLATGSPLEDLEPMTADDFEDSEPLDVDDDLLESDWTTGFARAAATEARALDLDEDDDARDVEPIEIDAEDEPDDVVIGARDERFEATRVEAADEQMADEHITAEPIEVSDLDDDFAIGSPAGDSDDVDDADADRRVPDLSPMMEQRIQETLEKVAWEAFSDLSESIVKQVMGRVEQIAWEVIPEMAETLVREEIRRMKGEDD